MPNEKNSDLPAEDGGEGIFYVFTEKFKDDPISLRRRSRSRDSVTNCEFFDIPQQIGKLERIFVRGESMIGELQRLLDTRLNILVIEEESFSQQIHSIDKLSVESDDSIKSWCEQQKQEIELKRNDVSSRRRQIHDTFSHNIDFLSKSLERLRKKLSNAQNEFDQGREKVHESHMKCIQAWISLQESWRDFDNLFTSKFRKDWSDRVVSPLSSSLKNLFKLYDSVEIEDGNLALMAREQIQSSSTPRTKAKSLLFSLSSRAGNLIEEREAWNTVLLHGQELEQRRESTSLYFKLHRDIVHEFNEFQKMMFSRELSYLSLETVIWQMNRWKIFSRLVSNETSLFPLDINAFNEFWSGELDFELIPELHLDPSSLKLETMFTIRTDLNLDDLLAGSIILGPLKTPLHLPCKHQLLKSFSRELELNVKRDINTKVKKQALVKLFTRRALNFNQGVSISVKANENQDISFQEESERISLKFRKGDLIRVLEHKKDFCFGCVILQRKRSNPGWFSTKRCSSLTINEKSNLNEFLEIPYGRRIFRLYLIIEHSEEEMDFLTDCESYKDLYISDTPASPRKDVSEFYTIKEYGREIMETYILEDSAISPVNISAGLRRDLNEIYLKELWDFNSFDRAMDEIYGLLSTGPFTRFKLSSLFKLKFLRNLVYVPVNTKSGQISSSSFARKE